MRYYDKTEDEIRDLSREVLGLNSSPEAVSGTGQLTTFNQLGFEGCNYKPDGWFLPYDQTKVALILEAKASNVKLNKSHREELLRNCEIVKAKYDKIVGILYNGHHLECYLNGVLFEDDKELLNKEVYFAFFEVNNIDKKRIYELTKQINDCLHFRFEIKNLYHRMILTACALVAERYGANLNAFKSAAVLKSGIREALEEHLEKDLIKNPKLKIVLDVFEKIGFSKPNEKDISKFSSAVTEISTHINSNFWQGEDVMAIFFNEFTRYKGKSEKGQVFTPDHITSLLYKLIDVRSNSNLLDGTCGSGAFLVKAMCYMVKSAGGPVSDESKSIVEHLFGIEVDPEIFALACANMLIHKDGKTNLALMDTRSKDAGIWIAEKSIDRVLMNPPFENKYGCLDIVINVLNNVKPGAICAFILPDNKLEKNKKKAKIILDSNRLLSVLKLPTSTFQNIGTETSVFIFEAQTHQDDIPVFGCYIQEDGLYTVKNQGRQDLWGNWKAIENYWVGVYQKRSGDKSIKWMKADTNIRYRVDYEMPPLKCSEFIKTYLHYLLFKENIVEQDFKESALNHLLYGDDILPKYEVFLKASEVRSIVDTSNWEAITLGSLFDISKGVRLTKANMRPGETNFIGASAFNNGVTNKIDNSESVNDGNKITVCYNGSIGSAFYQADPFWASDDVNVFSPKFELTPARAFFFCTLLRREGPKYQFLDKWTIDKMEKTELLVPTKDGEIDLQKIDLFMDSIMINLSPTE